MRYLVSRTDLVKDEDGTLLKVIGFTVDVTDLQHARQELNEKGHFIGRITETTPDVLYIYDLKQQRNVYANRRLPEVLGFTPEEVQQMGDRFLALFTHADDFPKVREAMEKLALASDTEVVEVEYRIMDPQGNWHWFFDRTTVFSRDPDGSVRQVLGSSQDVTDRKKGAEELRYKNRLIGLILSGFPLVLSRISKDGILLEATGPGLRNMGLSENQPAGLNLLSQYPDIAPYIREVMKGNKATFLSEMEVEGEKKYFQNYYFYDQEQDCAVGFSVDVTEQKEAEEKLAESRRFIEQITSAIPQIIYVFDLIEGRNIYLNREVYTSLGYSPEQIATMGSRVLEELQPPEEREMVQRHFERVAVMPDQVHELEYRMKDAGGNWRWFYCRDILFKSTPEGKPWQVLGSTQDITARKRSEEELRFKNKIIEGILSNLPVILCRIDEEGVIRESVGAGLRQLGRQDGGIVGENVFTNPGYAGVSAYIRRVLQGGSITFVGHPVHQGKSFYFLNYYYFDPEQRMAVGFSLDISQQKETEEKLKRSEEQLRELNTGLERRVQERTAELTASEERYRAFVQQSSEAIWRFEFDGIRELDTSLPEDEQIDLIYRHAYLAECNDTMAQMYGYDNAREITGTRFADLAPPSEPANADFLRSFIRAGYRLANAESVEVDRAGNLKYFLNNLTGITRGGNLIRAWGTQRDITDRRRAEDALRTSEERLELAVRAAGIGIFDWHIPEGTVILTGQEERIFGMAQDSFEGTLQGWMDFVLPEDYPGLWHQLQSGMDRRDPGLYAQYRISRTDGEIRWLEAVGKFIYDKAGTPMRAVGINVDITGRKLAGQALRESESRFRRLFESDMVGILFSDRTGVVTDANNAFLHLLGYTREELNAGRIRWKDITPAEYATLDEAAAQELIAKGLIAPYEKEYIRKDGSRVAVLIGATLLKEVTPGIAVGFVLDISDRKKAQERLHLSEERFRLVAEATNEGIWDWEISADKVWRNEGYYKLFGYEISEAASDFENWKMRLHPEDAERVKRGVEEALHSDRENWSDEYRIGRSDGTYAYIMDRACILRDKQGRPLRMIGSKIDLTQLKETQSALEQQAIELKQSNADLEQFAYISSHDLQEPLNTAASFAKLLRRRYENQLDDDANEFINFITDATDRMKGIIRSLLEYSRISSDGRQLTQVPVDKVLEEVQQNLKQRIAGSGAVIRIGIMPGVRANEAQMLQLFQNLIGNAVKFRSSQPPEITIQAEEQPGHWLFSVADNGIGMDMKHAGKKIFQVFQRLHARDEYEGTGIGLAISKKIVERHGGTIWADSQPGKGTVFYFTLKK